MKKYLFITILFVLVYQNLIAQGWQWINTGYPYIIFDMSFPSGQSDIGFAVGSTLTFGGEGAVLKTTDAGLSWTKITADTLPGLKTVCFTSVNVGYAAGHQNFLMKTTDGGLSWDKLFVDVKLWYFNNIEFWDENNGIIVSYPAEVYYTTDGGNIWSIAIGVKHSVEDVCYASQDVLYIVGGDEIIYKSTNGGFKWTKIYSGITFQLFLGVEFMNTSYGIVTGEGGKVLYTTDGGGFWNSCIAGGSGLLRSISILSYENSYVVGTPEEVYKTTDGGMTWLSDFAGGNEVALYKIKFTKNMTGLICGSDGKFLRNIDFVTPVELSSFIASVNGDDVQLSWSTESELNNSGFEIDRSENNNNWEIISFISGAGTCTEPKNYSFIDEDLKPAKYNYRLKQIDFDGTFKYSDVVEVNISIVTAYSLEQNYPNPFNPSTVIEFSLPEDASNVKISIYNALGENVDELLNSSLKSGNYKYRWNAEGFVSGIYIYELRTESYKDERKMLLIR